MGIGLMEAIRYQFHLDRDNWTVDHDKFVLHGRGDVACVAVLYEDVALLGRSE